MNNQAYYTPGYNVGAPTNDMAGGPGVDNLFTDPMANAAMMYGSSLASQGKDMVNKEVRSLCVCHCCSTITVLLQCALALKACQTSQSSGYQRTEPESSPEGRAGQATLDLNRHVSGEHVNSTQSLSSWVRHVTIEPDRHDDIIVISDARFALQQLKL